jgi:hypothetical protein
VVGNIVISHFSLYVIISFAFFSGHASQTLINVVRYLLLVLIFHIH